MTILKKLIKFAGDTWNILGIALLMFVFIEIGLSLTFYIRSFWHLPAQNFRTKADTYIGDSSGPSWADLYYQEIERMGRLRWRSYVYWRRAPSQGEHININSDGLRKTSKVASPEGSAPTVKVFMFGGSTVWGLGARDDFTIPSVFAKEAKNKGVNCDVVNFGQYAYVSTQGVMELILQLQKGNVPDAVIFLDGINDTFGAYQAGVPGLPHGEIAREREFNLLEKKEIKTLAIQSAINELSTVRFLNGILKSTGMRRDNVQLIPLKYEPPISDKKALAQATADIYLNNIKLILALSKSYDFKCLFYWQPVIYLKNNLTEYERKSIELGPNYSGMKEFYLDTYSFVQQRSTELMSDTDLRNAFHNISSLFKDIREPIYVDFNHTGERGNTLIAQRMVSDFTSLPVRRLKPIEHHDATKKPSQNRKDQENVAVGKIK